MQGRNPGSMDNLDSGQDRDVLGSLDKVPSGSVGTMRSIRLIIFSILSSNKWNSAIGTSNSGRISDIRGF